MKKILKQKNKTNQGSFEEKVMEQKQNLTNIEEILAVYNQRVQDQSAMIFALVGKFGGEVTLTENDLQVYSEFNTVSAKENNEKGLTLKLTYEER